MAMLPTRRIGDGDAHYWLGRVYQGEKNPDAAQKEFANTES